MISELVGVVEPVQLLQAVRAIKGGFKKNKFSKFVLHVLQGMDQVSRCTIENGIAVIQVRGNRTVWKGVKTQWN